MNDENNINKIVSLINNNKKSEAKIICQNEISNNPSSEIALSLMGNIFLLEKNFNEAKNYFLRALTINPKNYSSYIGLGIVSEKLNQNEEAINNFAKALKFKEGDFQALNNLGFINNKIKKFESAIQYLKECIEINNNYSAAHYNLGFAYFNTKELDKAKLHFSESLKLGHKAKDINFYLGEIFKSDANYLDALEHYKQSQHNKTKIRILEMLAITNKKNEYLKTLDELKINNDCDRRVASITPHISQEYKIENTYPFCPDPLDFILQFKLVDEKKIQLEFIDDLIKEIKEQEFNWETPMRTTVKGYTTKGNLSLKNLAKMKILEKTLLRCVNDYKENFKNKNCTFITSWPDTLAFHSWSNSLKKEGYNISHIHPSGWVSGVLYLMVPKDIKNDEAGIEFSLFGDDFIKNKNKTLNKIFKPSKADLIMFPSSLYHKTIPFKSNEERMCIAFDLMPS